MDGILPVLLAAFGIGFLIFIHEFGHFLCARLARVRVEVFSLGFGHRLLGVQWRGTDYRLSMIPLGGYVRVAGEEAQDRRFLAEDDLMAKGFGARALFYSGGVAMNLLFGLCAFILVFSNGVEFTAPVLGGLEPGGAAWEANLEPGDRILRVNGKEMYSFENLQVEVALAARKGVDLLVQRGESTFGVRVDPRYSEAMGLFNLGAFPATAEEPIRVERVDPGSKAAAAGLRAGDQIVAINGQRLLGDAAAQALAALRDHAGEPLALEVRRNGVARGSKAQTETITYVPPLTRTKSVRIGVRAATRRVRALRPGLDALDRLGLEHGDVIERIDGKPFTGDDLELTAGGDVLTMRVLRAGAPVDLAAPVTAADRAALAERIALEPVPGDRVAVVPFEDSPAAKAGILPGDVVAEVGGRPLDEWADLVAAVHDADEHPLRFRIERDGQELEVSVTPERQTGIDPGFDQVYQRQTHVYQVDSISGAIGAGFVASVDLIKQLYVTLKRLFTGDVAAKNLGGIIQISRVSYHYAHGGWAVFLHFLALLSINLAFINVLPIPVLDGGHLMFLLIEKIKGSPVSAQVMNYSQILGLVFVIALMVFVTYNDILKLL